MGCKMIICACMAFLAKFTLVAKRDRKEAQTRHPKMKRRREELPTSNVRSDVVVNSSSNDEKTLTATQVSLPGTSANENDDRSMLEEKLHARQIELKERDRRIGSLETEAMEANQVRMTLEATVAKMQQQLCRELEGSGSYVDGSATPTLLESRLKAVQTSAASFAKVFLQYAQEHDIHLHVTDALKTHFRNPYLTRLAHVTWLLKAWTFQMLFQDFENESFCCRGASIYLDPTERRLKSFEYFQLLECNSVVDTAADDRFGQFFRQKLKGLLSLCHLSTRQDKAVPNLSIDDRDDLEIILGAGDAKAGLMDSFKLLANGVWTLHKLSLSFRTPAQIFRVNQETEFDANYMDTVVSMEDDEQFVARVGFMICPGFRLNKSVFKCEIYLGAGVDQLSAGKFSDSVQMPRSLDASSVG